MLTMNERKNIPVSNSMCFSKRRPVAEKLRMRFRNLPNSICSIMLGATWSIETIGSNHTRSRWISPKADNVAGTHVYLHSGATVCRATRIVSRSSSIQADSHMRSCTATWLLRDSISLGVERHGRSSLLMWNIFRLYLFMNDVLNPMRTVGVQRF